MYSYRKVMRELIKLTNVTEFNVIINELKLTDEQKCWIKAIFNPRQRVTYDELARKYGTSKSTIQRTVIEVYNKLNFSLDKIVKK